MFKPKVPACCWGCKYFDEDYNEYTETLYYICNINVTFPTSKLSCKRRMGEDIEREGIGTTSVGDDDPDYIGDAIPYQNRSA